MTSHQNNEFKPATKARADVVSCYKKATYCYVAPFAFLLLAFIWSYSFGAFLLIILPCGIAGMVFTKRGLALAKKNGDAEKKDVGYANVILGIIILLLGLLVVAFAYVRSN